MSWTDAVRPFVPPIALTAYRKLRTGSQRIRFTGDYPTWEAALADSRGYDDAAILSRVRESASKVRDGLAAYERDGVAFDRPEHNFPLLACLLRVATECGNRLRVLDFGGSLGSTYYQCREFLSVIPELTWSVVEQPHFVECGRREFEDGRLRFHDTIESVGEVDLALLSGVLGWIPEPSPLLRRIAGSGAGALIVEKTLILEMERDAIVVQHVPAYIYGVEVSYPARIFSANLLTRRIESEWSPIVTVEPTELQLPWGTRFPSFGRWYCRRRTP